MTILLNHWWGWLQEDGTIHVCRYEGDKKIQNLEQLPLCKGIFNPFFARSYTEAKMKIYECYKEQQFHEKRMN